jgi:hypothetical protein
MKQQQALLNPDPLSFKKSPIMPLIENQMINTPKNDAAFKVPPPPL